MTSLYDCDGLYGLNPPVYIDTKGAYVIQSQFTKEGNYISNVKLVIHAKESPIRRRGKAFYLVSSRPISPAHAISSDGRGPHNLGLPR